MRRGVLFLCALAAILFPAGASGAEQLTAIDFGHTDIDPDESVVRVGRIVQTPTDPYVLTGTIEENYSNTSGAVVRKHFIVAVTATVTPPLGAIAIEASGTMTQSFVFAHDGLCGHPTMTNSGTITGGRYSQRASSDRGNLVLTGSLAWISTSYGATYDEFGNQTGCLTYTDTNTANGDLLSFQGAHEFGNTLPSVSIGDAVELEGGPGSNAVLSFPVTLSAPAPAGGVTVDYGTSDVTAQAGSDYHFTAGTLTFLAGETAQSVDVPINGDPDVEPDEALAVTLSNPSGATIAVSTATGTILNDDFAAVDFDWTMPERFGLDADGNSLIDYYTTAAAIAPETWRVDFTYAVGGNCDPSHQLVIKIDGVTVVLNDPALIFVDTSTCRAAYNFAAEARYEITFQLFESTGDVVGTAVHDVVVQDFLIVSLGDSVASGEGNPDISGTPVWQNRQCHRSASAGPAQAALAIERADSKTSVTFVHLACSGASVFEGILARYRGQEFGPWIPPQVDVMHDLVGDREIDAVTLSTGANDVEFARIVTGCFLQRNCHLSTTRNSMLQFFNTGLAALPGNYDALGLTLRAPQHEVPPERTYITEYYDPMKDQDGNFCDQVILEEAWNLPVFGISAAESQWASTDMLVRLNQEVSDAAARNGWRYVGGIHAAFGPHGYCSNDRWVVQLTESLADQRNIDGTLHPNEVGQAFYGARLASSLTADLYTGGDLDQPREPR